MDTQNQNAIVKDISRPTREGLCNLTVTYLKRDGTPLNFPNSYKDIAASVLDAFNPGDQVTVTTKKGRPKNDVKPEDQNNELKAFWWDFQAIRAGHGAAPAPAQAPAAAPAASGPAQAAAEAPRPAQGQQAQVPVDARDRSIQRQVALKCATDWAIARVQTGKEVSTYHLLQIAQWMAVLMETDTLPRGSKVGQALKAAGAVEVPDEGEPWEEIFGHEERAA